MSEYKHNHGYSFRERCTIAAHPYQWVPIEGRLLKPPSPSNKSASHFFGSLGEPNHYCLVVEGECMHVSHALRSWKEAAR